MKHSNCFDLLHLMSNFSRDEECDFSKQRCARDSIYDKTFKFILAWGFSWSSDIFYYVTSVRDCFPLINPGLVMENLFIFVFNDALSSAAWPASLSFVKSQVYIDLIQRSTHRSHPEIDIVWFDDIVYRIEESFRGLAFLFVFWDVRCDKFESNIFFLYSQFQCDTC